MATNKRRQDEKHLKMLREMVALPQNKQCFDCHQRGPTYVNMTIGSYVCTSCSGILRGLNPPHRVKSISMASFTSDEMEFLKCHGNEFCRKVWLGLYDPRSGPELDSREEQKVKDFMVQKYERKRWHVAPTETLKEEARRINESALNKNTVKPLRSLLGDNAPRLILQNNQGSHSSKSHSAVAPPAISQPPQQLPLTQNLTIAQQAQQAQQPQPASSAPFDLLGDLGGDPFASTPPTSTATSSGGFADFSHFGSQSSTPTGVTTGFPSASNVPLQPLGTNTTPSLVSNGGFANFSSSTAAPPVPATAQLTASASDKYAALADLDSVFGVTTNSIKVAPPPQPTGTSSWSTASSTSGSVWGSSANTTPTTGFNWVGSGSATNTTWSGTGMPWGGVTNAGTVSSSSGFGTSVSNPFNPTTNSTFSQAPGGTVAGNPFAGGGQSFFGSQPVSSSGGFGQFGAPATSGFGQFGIQNGGFGSIGAAATSGTTGFGMTQTAPSFGAGTGLPGQMDKFGGGGFGAQQPQGFSGAWNQVPTHSANPFMSAAAQQQVPPRSSSTNPFL